MTHFLKSNLEWMLAAIGLLLLAVLAIFAVWIVTRTSLELGAAMSGGDKNASKIQFDLQGARTMDLKGLSTK
jgi:hypothetical protein